MTSAMVGGGVYFIRYLGLASYEISFATGIELVPLSAFINTAELQVDKPFLFIIRDKVKEVPLFVGKVMDPTRQN